jgi:hypothetical protein
MADSEPQTPAQTARQNFEAAEPGPSTTDSAAAQATAGVLVDLLALGDGADEELRALARELMDAAKKLGVATWHAARGVVIGALRGSRELELDPWHAIRLLTVAIVEHVHKTGGDYGAAAKGAVEGAIRGAEERGLNEPRAASEAATAAWVCSKDLHQDAEERIRKILTARVAGVPCVIKR